MSAERFFYTPTDEQVVSGAPIEVAAGVELVHKDPTMALGRLVLKALQENTTITREAWHAIVTGQQAAPPLNEGDFQEIDLCANDAEDEFIEPHMRLKKLLPVAQERHLTNKEPIAVIMGGAIYHIGLKVEDITGIVAKCR